MRLMKNTRNKLTAPATKKGKREGGKKKNGYMEMPIFFLRWKMTVIKLTKHERR